ncbi:MAG: metalloregulator ArsR/SmtB family transcription factor [Elusimicrobia bacterium]|nr:metalloregulator ArsR/SmtB family transcription factor [Elusimicrobiota bacterium]
MSLKPPTDRMFRAFADQTRLRILALLSRGELCVCDITSALKIAQPKASRHLAYLRGAGLVRVRREGLWKHYSLAQARGGFHRGLLGCLRGCFAEVESLRRDARRLSAQRRGRCS